MNFVMALSWLLHWSTLLQRVKRSGLDYHNDSAYTIRILFVIFNRRWWILRLRSRRVLSTCIINTNRSHISNCSLWPMAPDRSQYRRGWVGPLEVHRLHRLYRAVSKEDIINWGRVLLKIVCPMTFFLNLDALRLQTSIGSLQKPLFWLYRTKNAPTKFCL